MTAGILTIRFTSKGHIGSELAALGARAGGFNHCMVLERGMAYEATVWHGVRWVPERVAMQGIVRCQDMHVHVHNIEAARRFLQRQLGSGYDFLGAAGLPFLRAGDWQDPERWWCGELAIAALMAGGVYIVDPELAPWGTLRDLYKFAVPKDEVSHLGPFSRRH